MSKLRKIFPGGNTSLGFFSLHQYIVSENRNRLYIFKGMSGGGKSSFMRSLGEKMIELGYSIEYHYCPSDPNSLDALVIKELKVIIIDGTAPHIMDPTYPGFTDKIIDLAQYIKPEIPQERRENIRIAKLNNKSAYRKAFNYFKAARVIIEEIEASNEVLVDKEAVNIETIDLINKIFSKQPVVIEHGESKERHLFSTAYTPSGFVDHTDLILDGIEDIYFINGEIGTGKVDMLNKLLDQAKLRDYHLEIFHDSLLPDRIETIYIKDLNTIVTINKTGALYANYRIDLNKYMQIGKINESDYDQMNILVQKGIENLSEAKKNHFEIEKAYANYIDFDSINKIKEQMFDEIMGFAIK